jgi:hypothetical protein
MRVRIFGLIRHVATSEQWQFVSIVTAAIITTSITLY